MNNLEIGLRLCTFNLCVCVCVRVQEEYCEMGDFINRGQADGWLRPVVGHEYSLDQAVAAHVDVIEHKTTKKGKIVLNI